MGPGQADVASLGAELRREVISRAESPGTPRGVTLLGVGQRDIMLGLARLESACRSRVRSINPMCAYDPEDPSLLLNHRSRAKGVEVRLVTSARASRFHPLLSSIEPEVRIGPATVRCLVVDDTVAVVEGPDVHGGESTAWVVTSGPLLARAIELWELVWEQSRPVLAPHEAPPLEHRQLEVARMMCLGRTDAAIARALAASPRTVARDVARILDLTGARSRPEAVLAMLGRGRHTRT